LRGSPRSSTARSYGLHGVAFALKSIGHRAADHGIIFNQEDSHGPSIGRSIFEALLSLGSSRSSDSREGMNSLLLAALLLCGSAAASAVRPLGSPLLTG
jgi:hypothetical protein